MGHAVRGLGVWSYGIINLFHILGVATLLGSAFALDLKLLGAFSRAPLSMVSATAVPLAVGGFCVATLSGICLISANATDYIGNPFLLIKFPAIAVALVNVALVHRLPAWKVRWTHSPSPRERKQLALFGGISLAAWLTAAAAGRMIGYW